MRRLAASALLLALLSGCAGHLSHDDAEAWGYEGRRAQWTAGY